MRRTLGEAARRADWHGGAEMATPSAPGCSRSFRCREIFGNLLHLRDDSSIIFWNFWAWRRDMDASRPTFSFTRNPPFTHGSMLSMNFRLMICLRLARKNGTVLRHVSIGHPRGSAALDRRHRRAI
jgi:hypothetical protein